MKTKATFCLQNSLKSVSRLCRPSALALLTAVLCVSLSATAAPKDSERGREFKNPQQPHKAQHKVQPNVQQKAQSKAQQKTHDISPQQAVSIARQRQPGKVLSVKRSNGYYKVKMLHEGKVRYVKVNAN
ncbi:hypothetical protein KOI40_12755 [Aestuariicella sp. G3-2]|uniref:PepSY domain-containing protein n=1 Tax=Pseudomaricurvus albidus TaxID=2842452 RepID=UPI001C0D9041|nr:PepSY domain-containing protein [Aestuariicella albida]MBU3070695.1 hypothetical protein [Aestuariicella albida]